MDEDEQRGKTMMGAISIFKSNGDETFTIHDGDFLRLERPDGEIQVRECSYIDDCHLRVGLNEYHKDEFALRMEQLGVKYSQVDQLESICGYLITDKTVVGKKSIVVGHNPEVVQPYVTWIAHNELNGYAWGHYYSSRRSAYKDYAKRIAEEQGQQSQYKQKNFER